MFTIIICMIIMSSNNGDVARIVSWNVRGLNHPVKRGKILAHLKSLNVDIIYLQETHIKNTAKQKLRMGWGSQVFQSNFGARARGVAIIITKNASFDHRCTIGDPNGRFIIVSGTLNGIPVTDSFEWDSRCGRHKHYNGGRLQLYN